MKQLTKFQNAVYVVGGILLIVGAILWPINWMPSIILYCMSAISFSCMQFLSRYEGKSFIIRRLRRQQILGSLLLLVTGVLMIADKLHLVYLHHNEWIACLSIAALLECYTAFRIPYELKKEE